MNNDFKATLIFIFGFIISGCGSLYKADGLYQHPDFDKYSSYYLEYKELYLGISEVEYAIDINYGHLQGNTIGVCRRPESDFLTRTITIDYAFWNKSNEESKLRLIFHELAHCDLNCGHQDDERGIMNETMGANEPFFTEKEIKAMFLECK